MDRLRPLLPSYGYETRLGVKAMLDAIFLIVTTLLFVLLVGYTHACDKL